MSEFNNQPSGREAAREPTMIVPRIIASLSDSARAALMADLPSGSASQGMDSLAESLGAEWAQVCFDLAFAFSVGAHGIEQDPGRAAVFYQYAKEGGMPAARHEQAVAWGHDSEVYREAYEWYRSAAARGDAAAQLIIAMHDDVHEQAGDVHEFAVVGDANAMTKLGFYYAEGIHLTQSNAKALFWMQKAADAGNPQALHWFALHYLTGRIVEKDVAKAVVLLEQAAESGDANMQYYLGRVLDTGEFGMQDKVRAAHWYARSADQGYEAAIVNLAHMYRDGDGVAQSDTKAFELYRNGAAVGSRVCAAAVGMYYLRGVGVEQNIPEGLQWVTRAAKHGDTKAQFNLGVFYQKGKYVPRDAATAVEWYTRAAEAGEVAAQVNLGAMHRQGKDIPENRQKAASLYRQAALQGDPYGLYSLGALYHEGTDGIQTDDVKAYVLFAAAGECGYEDARKAMQSVYEDIAPEEREEFMRKAQACFQSGSYLQ